MTRVSENQVSRSLINRIISNRNQVNKYSDQVSSGIAVKNPGDSSSAGTIAQFQDTLEKIKGHQERVKGVKGFLEYQDNILAKTTELLIRAKEIGTQAANDSVGLTGRAQMAEELIQIRDHIASFGNSTYQGKYIFAGTDDDDPPYDLVNYTSGTLQTNGAQYYAYDNEFGTSNTRSVKINDDISLDVNTPGSSIFSTALEAVERLSRALQGSILTPATGTINGGSTQLNFPNDFPIQSAEIRKTIDLLNIARENEVQIERVNLGGKLRRIEIAESVMELSKQSAEDLVDKFQSADIAESASKLSLANTALEASYTVSSRVLSLSILDYI